MNSGAIITAREGLGLSQRASRRLLRHTHASSQPVRGISTRRGKGREGKHDACVFVLDAAQRDRRRVMLTRRHKKQAQKTSTNTDTHTDTHTDTNTDTQLGDLITPALEPAVILPRPQPLWALIPTPPNLQEHKAERRTGGG